ncbi:splicing factor U2AF 65 kDa subunit-like, partial [Telopea speciosissima]|uniref:splicing factor U2AF 65 kDa subunit-like n=1 Tax=Telopea speciosissima TaxID=54955 RepID=UPI001CC3A10C
MEEEKAAAYYDELTRKGEGAARFKQGLGFSSQSSDTTTDTAPARGYALPSSSAFLSNFVRASSPGKTSLLEKQAQLESIQNKLKKKQSSEHEPRILDHRSRDDSRKSRRRSSSRERGRHSRRRSRSRDDHDSRRRFRSSSRERERDRRSERRRRSRSG